MKKKDTSLCEVGIGNRTNQEYNFIKTPHFNHPQDNSSTYSEDFMSDKAEKKRREHLKKLKKQRENLKKMAKRGKIVSKLSKGKLIIPKKGGQPILKNAPRPSANEAKPNKTEEKKA